MVTLPLVMKLFRVVRVTISKGGIHENFHSDLGVPELVANILPVLSHVDRLGNTDLLVLDYC